MSWKQTRPVRVSSRAQNAAIICFTLKYRGKFEIRARWRALNVNGLADTPSAVFIWRRRCALLTTDAATKSQHFPLPPVPIQIHFLEARFMSAFFFECCNVLWMIFTFTFSYMMSIKTLLINSHIPIFTLLKESCTCKTISMCFRHPLLSFNKGYYGDRQQFSACSIPSLTFRFKLSDYFQRHCCPRRLCTMHA